MRKKRNVMFEEHRLFPSRVVRRYDPPISSQTQELKSLTMESMPDAWCVQYEPTGLLHIASSNLAMLSMPILPGSTSPKRRNQDEPASSSVPSRTSMSPSLSAACTAFSFECSRSSRAASTAAYTPSSRFFARKDRLTFERVDFAMF